MAILDAGMHLAGEQVDPGEQAQRAMALVFVVTREGRMRSGPRREVGCGVADRLDARLLVIRDDRDVRVVGFVFPQDGDLGIDAEHVGHLRLECLVASFEVVADLVRLKSGVKTGPLSSPDPYFACGDTNVWVCPYCADVTKKDGRC